jgi:hypothetical protein
MGPEMDKELRLEAKSLSTAIDSLPLTSEGVAGRTSSGGGGLEVILID